MLSQNCCNTSHDFVDYFFQKEGDTYIAALSKTKNEHEDQCERLLANSSDSVRSEYTAFRCKLLDVDKIVPAFDNIDNFDFVESIWCVFSDLEIDVRENVDIIQKYLEFIKSLHCHWKGLDVEATTIIETSVQLMATLESMVYPLFLKITQYIGKLATNPELSNPTNSPDQLMLRLHKLGEILTKQIASIGSSGCMTIGKLPTTTKESLYTDSMKLGCQGRNAKNCIAWALKSVSPTLLFYFLQIANCKQSHASQGRNSAGSCSCRTGHFGHVPAPTGDCTRTEKPKVSACDDARAEERRIIALTEEGERRLKQTIAEAERLICSLAQVCGNKGPSEINETRRSCREAVVEKEQGCSPCAKKEQEIVQNKRCSEKKEEEVRRCSEKKEEEVRRCSEKKEEEVRRNSAEGKDCQQRPPKPAPAEESESGSATSESENEVQAKGDTQTKSTKNRENHEIITSHDPSKGKDFVDYFFMRDGQKYIEILTESKTKYEKSCKSILKTVGGDIRQNAKTFMATVHNVRKVEPVTKEIEVGDFKFSDCFAHATVGLHISVADKLTMLHKYNEYTRSMIRHWLYRIEKGLELNPESVVDGGTQMMATTMSLTYPVFIRIGEFLQKISRNVESSKSKYLPAQLANQFHQLVEINALQMAAIGMSCINVIAKMPNITKESLKVHSNSIAVQAKFAKNSISWAMKAISPLLLLYFIRCENLHPGAEVKYPDSGTGEMKVPENGAKKPRPIIVEQNQKDQQNGNPKEGRKKRKVAPDKEAL